MATLAATTGVAVGIGVGVAPVGSGVTATIAGAVIGLQAARSNKKQPASTERPPTGVNHFVPKKRFITSIVLHRSKEQSSK
jgi:hypothetical protein